MTDHEQRISSKVVEIDAPAALAWEVLTDFECYAAWNSFTPKVEVSFLADGPVGSPVRLWVPSLRDTDPVDVVTHIIEVFDPPRQLSWRHRPTPTVPHLTRRDQYLEVVSRSICRYYNTDTFFGETAASLFEKHGVWVKRGLDTVADEVKARAEFLARGPEF